MGRTKIRKCDIEHSVDAANFDFCCMNKIELGQQAKKHHKWKRLIRT